MAEQEVLVTPPREDTNDLTLTVSAVKVEAHDLILELLERALALLLQRWLVVLLQVAGVRQVQAVVLQELTEVRNHLDGDTRSKRRTDDLEPGEQTPTQASHPNTTALLAS